MNRFGRLFLIAAVGLFLISPFWHHLAHAPVAPCVGHNQGVHLTAPMGSDGHDCLLCLMTVFFVASFFLLMLPSHYLFAQPARIPVLQFRPVIRVGSRAPPR
jgi:hypothetical protein